MPTDPVRLAARRKYNRVRVQAWEAKRTEQTAWFRRVGLTDLRRRRDALLSAKQALERELLAA